MVKGVAKKKRSYARKVKGAVAKSKSRYSRYSKKSRSSAVRPYTSRAYHFYFRGSRDGLDAYSAWRTLTGFATNTTPVDFDHHYSGLRVSNDTLSDMLGSRLPSSPFVLSEPFSTVIKAMNGPSTMNQPNYISFTPFSKPGHPSQMIRKMIDRLGTSTVTIRYNVADRRLIPDDLEVFLPDDGSIVITVTVKEYLLTGERSYGAAPDLTSANGPRFDRATKAVLNPDFSSTQDFNALKAERELMISQLRGSTQESESYRTQMTQQSEALRQAEERIATLIRAGQQLESQMRGQSATQPL